MCILNNTPDISVILPVHRASSSIELAIQSILNQTKKNFELIIVQNDSDFKTKKIISDFGDPRILRINLEVANVAEAFNAGYKLSRAPIIARMDADDISLPRRLEMQYEYLIENPRVDVVSCKVAFESTLKLSDGFKMYVDWQNTLLMHAEIYNNRFVESPVINPSCMFRASVVETIGRQQSGNFPEDYDFWLKALSAGFIFSKLDQELFVWKDHAGRLTRSDIRYNQDAFHKLKVKFLAQYLKQKSVGIKKIFFDDSLKISNNYEKKKNMDSRALIVWGAGKISRKYSRLLLQEGLYISAYIDIDPKKIGRKINDAIVYLPEILKGSNKAFVVSYVPGSGARILIKNYLSKAGFISGIDYLCAA